MFFKVIFQVPLGIVDVLNLTLWNFWELGRVWVGVFITLSGEVTEAS